MAMTDVLKRLFNHKSKSVNDGSLAGKSKSVAACIIKVFTTLVITSQLMAFSPPKTTGIPETPKQVIAHCLTLVYVFGIEVIPQRVADRASGEFPSCDLDTLDGLKQCCIWIRKYYPEVRATAVITEEALRSKSTYKSWSNDGIKRAHDVVNLFSRQYTLKIAAAISTIEGSYSDELYLEIEKSAMDIIQERDNTWKD